MMELKMYGKQGVLKQVFKTKKGYVLLPAGVELVGLDGSYEEE